MQIVQKQLKPLSGISLSEEENKIIKWLRSATWEPQTSARDPIPYKTKVPEFYSGVRLYRLQNTGGTGGSQSPLEIFIKKLEYNSIITKQDMYPVAVQDGARFLSLKKADLDNLGVGNSEEDED